MTKHLHLHDDDEHKSVFPFRLRLLQLCSHLQHHSFCSDFAHFWAVSLLALLSALKRVQEGNGVPQVTNVQKEVCAQIIAGAVC